jgi:hypothetical protein
MLDLLFDMPWYLPVSLIVIGVGLFVWGNNHVRRDVRWTGISIVAFAVLAFLAGYFFETPREIVARRTRELTAAVVAADPARINSYLDSTAHAYRWGRQDIVDGAVRYAQTTGLKGARIIRLQTETDPYGIVCHLGVWSQHQGGQSSLTDLTSHWKLIWRQRGDIWLVQEIIPIQIGQTPAEEIENRFLDRPPH